MDYGTVSCSVAPGGGGGEAAADDVGPGRPCVFHIVPAGQSNCTSSNLNYAYVVSRGRGSGRKKGSQANYRVSKSVTTFIAHKLCIGRQIMKPFEPCIHETVRFFLCKILISSWSCAPETGESILNNILLLLRVVCSNCHYHSKMREVLIKSHIVPNSATWSQLQTKRYHMVLL